MAAVAAVAGGEEAGAVEAAAQDAQGVRQFRGGIATTTETMNDARVTGTGTWSFSLDLYTDAAPEWGTFKLENAQGAWEGTCTGASWNMGVSAIGGCWLIGSGGYEGYTYYRYMQTTEIQGIVFEGSPPSP